MIQHINWTLTLDVPQHDVGPTFADIAGRIHSDHKMLAAIPFKLLSVGSIGEYKAASVDDISVEEFTKAARNLVRSWQAADE